MLPDADGMVAAALDGTGLRPTEIAPRGVEPTADGHIYGYAVRAVDEDGAAQALLVYVDTSPPASPPGTARVIRQPRTGREATAWLYPNDPALPALRAATVPGAASHVLEGLGFVLPDPTMTVVSYRPGKRAVIRVSADIREYYLKVLRPERVAAVRSLHETLIAGGIPAPTVLASSTDGMLVLAALTGTTALRALDTQPPGGATALLRAALDMAGRLAGADVRTTGRPGALARYDWYATSLTELLPDRRTRLDEVFGRIAPLATPLDPALRQVVHGDLHLDQLMVLPDDPSTVTGILDIDTVGIGDPLEDAAGLAAHLAVTGVMRRDSRLTDVADEWIALWREAHPENADDRVRAARAAHLLAHTLTFAPSSDPESLDTVDALIDAAARLLRPRRH
jgi:Phosphotransferase enzyme family